MNIPGKPRSAPRGMTFKKMLSLPVNKGKWRELDQFVCCHCIQPAFVHPYTNDIWGCRECGTTTTRLQDNFLAVFGTPQGEGELPVETRSDARTDFEPGTVDQTPATSSAEDQLPEFRVTLHRPTKAKSAVDPHDRQNLGARTKLGGSPDWIQLHDETPKCKKCKEKMTFVAQIDSIDHVSIANTRRTQSKRGDPSKRRWMFEDVGMIYVFYCFNCGETRSVVQSY